MGEARAGLKRNIPHALESDPGRTWRESVKNKTKQNNVEPLFLRNPDNFVSMVETQLICSTISQHALCQGLFLTPVTRR